MAASEQLKPNEIHLWSILVTPHPALVAGLRGPGILSPDELLRANRFKFPEHRMRYSVAHTALRKILAQYVNESPEKLIFSEHEYGKPYLKNYPEIQFNLSHAENMAVCAITLTQPIGVDVEYIKKEIDVLPLAKRFFAKAEYAYLAALSGDELQLAFFKLWTRKEAWIKARGLGLHEELMQFNALNDHHALQDFVIDQDYLGAIALDQSEFTQTFKQITTRRMSF